MMEYKARFNPGRSIVVTQKKVGFFFEQSADEQRSQLNSLRNVEPHIREAEIIQYLNSGVEAGVYMMHEHDYLKEPPAFIVEAILKSDGEWIWPASLAYFVREYHLTLPTEFLEKMEQQNWRVSPDVEYSPEIPDGHVENVKSLRLQHHDLRWLGINCRPKVERFESLPVFSCFHC